MSVIVHHLNNSRSQRVLWLLEELGVPYTIKKYQRDPKTMLAPPELKKVHPLGKSPVVEVDGRVIAESGLITEFLVDKFGRDKLAPPATDTGASLKYKYWLYFAEGSAMPPLLLSLLFNVTGEKAPWLVRPIARAISSGVHKSFIDPNITAIQDMLEGELNQHEWLVDDKFSAADIIMSFPIESMEARGAFGTKYPKLQAYLTKIHERPAYKAALEKGGQYDIIGKNK